MTYARLRLRLPGDVVEARTVRILNETEHLITGLRVKRDGDDTEPREIIVAAPRDVVERTPLRMNLHYGELEVDR